MKSLHLVGSALLAKGEAFFAPRLTGEESVEVKSYSIRSTKLQFGEAIAYVTSS